MHDPEFSAQSIVSAVFQPMSVGGRMRAARLRSGKSIAELTTSLSMGNETQYLEIEAGRSPLEKYGAILGRMSVRFGVPVSHLLDGPASGSAAPDTVGGRMSKLRHEVSLTVLDVCRHLTIKRTGRNFTDDLSTTPGTGNGEETKKDDSEKSDDDTQEGVAENSGRDADPDRRASYDEAGGSAELKSSSPAGEPTLLISEKELSLLESGGHVLFERWMTILSAFCRVIRCDPFALVLGV